MSQKKDKQLRQSFGYKPGATRYHLTNKRTDDKGNVTFTRVCTGLRAEYLKAKRSQ